MALSKKILAIIRPNYQKRKLIK